MAGLEVVEAIMPQELLVQTLKFPPLVVEVVEVKIPPRLQQRNLLAEQAEQFLGMLFLAELLLVEPQEAEQDRLGRLLLGLMCIVAEGALEEEAQYLQMAGMVALELIMVLAEAGEDVAPLDLLQAQAERGPMALL